MRGFHLWIAGIEKGRLHLGQREKSTSLAPENTSSEDASQPFNAIATNSHGKQDFAHSALNTQVLKRRTIEELLFVRLNLPHHLINLITQINCAVLHHHEKKTKCRPLPIMWHPLTPRGTTQVYPACSSTNRSQQTKKKQAQIYSTCKQEFSNLSIFIE